MGEEALELGHLFMKVGDGGYVPFEGFKPADIVCIDEMDEELYNSSEWLSGIVKFMEDFKSESYSDSEMHILVNIISHKEFRRWKKYFHAMANKFRREVRTRERRKEKLRRRALKAGFKMYHGYLKQKET